MNFIIAAPAKNLFVKKYQIVENVVEILKVKFCLVIRVL